MNLFYQYKNRDFVIFPFSHFLDKTLLQPPKVEIQTIYSSYKLNKLIKTHQNTK